MNRLRDVINYYVSSLFYPLSLVLIAFIGWLSYLPWLATPLLALLCFAPLFGDDGRGYQAAPLCVVPLIREKLVFSAMKPYMYVVIACYIVSLIAFIVLHRPTFRPGALFYPFLALFTIFLISVIADCVTSNKFESDALLFIISMLLIVGESALSRSVLAENKDSFRYLSWCAIALSLVISLEVFVYYIQYPDQLFEENIAVGWATNKQMLSTLLVGSLPFYGILIYRKRPWYGLLMAFPLIANILLATESGLLAMIIFFIPLVLVSFRNYGKAYPYISLGTCAIFVLTFAFALGFSKDFQSLFVTSIKSLNLRDSTNTPIYDFAYDGFIQKPWLGPSAQGLIDIFDAEKGQVFLLRNTFLSTAFMGGSLGLVVYAYTLFTAYYVCFTRKTPDRWLLLIFLLSIDFIGLTDNTVYNLFFLVFYLSTMVSYQSSNTYSRAVIKDDYYRDYDRALREY